MWQSAHPHRSGAPALLRITDILALNHARGKQRSSGKKHMVLLFLILVQALLMLNLGFGFSERIENYFYDSQYPHDSLLVVYLPDPDDPDQMTYRKRAIDKEKVAALHQLEGVYAVQSRFDFTSGHFFLMSRVNYLEPEFLLGYDKAIFDLYRVVPEDQRIAGTIPILLSADMFALSYDETHFVRSAQTDKAAFLGQEIAIIMRPMLKVGRQGDFFLNPAAHVQALTDDINKSYLKIVQEKPRLQRFYRPVKLRFQIVGYVRDRTQFGPAPKAFGVIPSNYETQIQSLLQTRAAGVSGVDKKPVDAIDSVYLLTTPTKVAQIKQRVQALGLVAVGRDDINRLMLPDIVQTMMETAGFKQFVLTVFGIMALFIVFFVYHLLSARVGDAWREIGTMRCLGASKKDIRAIFWHLCLRDLMKVMLSAIIVTNALLWGVGYWSAQQLNQLSVSLVKDFDLIAGFGDFSASWLTAPIQVQLVLLLVLVPIALLAAVIPVAKASRVDPVVAMKEG